MWNRGKVTWHNRWPPEVVHSLYGDWFIYSWVDMKYMAMRNWFATVWSVLAIIFLRTLDGARRWKQPQLSLRPRPPVSGYFWIRNFFFPDSQISPSTRSVLKSNSPVHTHPMVSGFTLVPKAPLHKNVLRACAIERAIVAGNLHVVPPYWFIAR